MTPRPSSPPSPHTSSSKGPSVKKAPAVSTGGAAPPDDFVRSVHDLVFAPRGDVFRSPEDWRDQVLYELMIDRFDDATERPMYEPPRPQRGAAAKSASTAEP